MRTVHDILMRKMNKEIWSINPKAMVFEALALMGQKEVGALVVKDDAGKVVGIISERDYARKVILKGKASKETAVQEIMTPIADMFVVKPENTVEECMVIMTGKKVRHLPVFKDNGFVGLVSIGDVVKSIIAEQEMLIEQLSEYIAGKYI
jgi:CBS domain-containing protein